MLWHLRAIYLSSVCVCSPPFWPPLRFAHVLRSPANLPCALSRPTTVRVRSCARPECISVECVSGVAPLTIAMHCDRGAIMEIACGRSVGRGRVALSARVRHEYEYDGRRVRARVISSPPVCTQPVSASISGRRTHDSRRHKCYFQSHNFIVRVCVCMRVFVPV